LYAGWYNADYAGFPREEENMNAGFLVIPLLLIRYGLLALLSCAAFRRAAHFAPLIGKEKAAYWMYQATSLGVLLYPFFLTVRADTFWFYIGLGVYAAGAALCAASVVNYAKPKASGINTGGLYRFSRNPMYIAYFLYFLGCAAMTRSVILLAVVIVNQVSVHFIIISEERWCLGKFGDEYREYIKRVRRYI
jgi:protein-S-isoprenylcysteine O-methyltransferase Ste14